MESPCLVTSSMPIISLKKVADSSSLGVVISKCASWFNKRRAMIFPPLRVNTVRSIKCRKLLYFKITFEADRRVGTNPDLESARFDPVEHIWPDKGEI